MKRFITICLLLIFPLSPKVYAQDVLKKWKDIEKVGWKNYKGGYWYNYFSSDSLTQVTHNYDTLNHISSLYSFIGYGFTKAPYDSTLTVVDYKLNGPHVEFYSNQKVKSISNYFFDVPIGRWISYYPNGEIERIENYPSDSSIYLLCREYFIFISDGHVRARGITSSGLNIVKSVPHGEWLEFYDNGSIKAKKEFYMGLETGLWEWYYANGIKKREGRYFEEYLIQHPCEVTAITHSWGMFDIEDFHSGKHYVHIRPKHGTWKYWDDKGNLIKEELYDQGKLILPKKKSSVKK